MIGSSAQIGMHHRGDGLAGGQACDVSAAESATESASGQADAIVGRFRREMWNIVFLLT